MSVSRSIFALVDDRDRDQVGNIDANTRAIFGRSYTAGPDVLVKELAGDKAIKAADTLLLTIPNQLGGLQRPRARKHPQIRRSRTRLALTASNRPQSFFLNASSSCLLRSLKLLPRNFSSSSVRILKGTRTTLWANFTLSQCCPYAMPPGILK